jgi:hypothetical protein
MQPTSLKKEKNMQKTKKIFLSLMLFFLLASISSDTGTNAAASCTGKQGNCVKCVSSTNQWWWTISRRCKTVATDAYGSTSNVSEIWSVRQQSHTDCHGGTSATRGNHLLQEKIVSYGTCQYGCTETLGQYGLYNASCNAAPVCHVWKNKPCAGCQTTDPRDANYGCGTGETRCSATNMAGVGVCPSANGWWEKQSQTCACPATNCNPDWSDTNNFRCGANGVREVKKVRDSCNSVFEDWFPYPCASGETCSGANGTCGTCTLGAWSDCTATCNGGTRTRTNSCVVGGIETGDCNTQACTEPNYKAVMKVKCPAPGGVDSIAGVLESDIINVTPRKVKIRKGGHNYNVALVDKDDTTLGSCSKVQVDSMTYRMRKCNPPDTVCT